MLTRRTFIKSLGTTFIGGLALGGYAFGVEPQRLRVREYNVKPANWPSGLKLKLAALADIHSCAPWMTPEHIRSIVETSNGLGADIVVLLGDYEASHRFITNKIPSDEWASALAGLRAPLGVHAILGNHDWWDDHAAQINGHGPVIARLALERAGVAVYENLATEIKASGGSFWLAGLGDQLALLSGRKWGRTHVEGVDDLAGTMSQITDNGPVIMLAHEPDIFPDLPDTISLTLAGHTHGGQVRLLGYSPVVPSKFGNR